MRSWTRLRATDEVRRRSSARAVFGHAVGVALLPALLGACVGGGYDELPSYRYRLTVEIATPEGIRRGSSVIEVRTWQSSTNNPDSPGAIRHRENGDAVSIDMGPRGVLFALMRAGNWMDWPGSVATTLVPAGHGDPHVYRRAEIMAVKALKGVHDVPRTTPSGVVQMQNWPDFVRFADPARPETIAWVAPSQLDTAFGAGVVLRSVTIEIVDVPVTRNIVRQLPWLADPAGEARLPANLSRGDEDAFVPPLASIDFTRKVD